MEEKEGAVDGLGIVAARGRGWVDRCSWKV